MCRCCRFVAATARECAGNKRYFIFWSARDRKIGLDVDVSARQENRIRCRCKPDVRMMSEQGKGNRWYTEFHMEADLVVKNIDRS